MADREQSHTSERGMDEKQPRDTTGRGGKNQGDLLKEREYHPKPGGTVGRDVPDESKERHTEIAVEAGHKGGARHDNKR